LNNTTNLIIDKLNHSILLNGIKHLLFLNLFLFILNLLYRLLKNQKLQCSL